MPLKSYSYFLKKIGEIFFFLHFFLTLNYSCKAVVPPFLEYLNAIFGWSRSMGQNDPLCSPKVKLRNRISRNVESQGRTNYVLSNCRLRAAGKRITRFDEWERVRVREMCPLAHTSNAARSSTASSVVMLLLDFLILLERLPLSLPLSLQILLPRTPPTDRLNRGSFNRGSSVLCKINVLDIFDMVYFFHISVISQSRGESAALWYFSVSIFLGK